MSKILPVSDLRNYNRVLENVSDGSPVFLTVNGRGKYVIKSIEDEEENNRLRASIELMCELIVGHESGKEEGYLTENEVREYFAGKKK